MAIHVGRARADGAQYVLVGEREHGTIAKDEVHKLRERMTVDAVKSIDAMSQDVITQKITELQLKAKRERDIESKGKEFKAAVRQSHEGEHQLR